MNVLGADVARQLLDIGGLDEVLTYVPPVLLGDGARLFSWPGGREIRLEHIHITDRAHATGLWFRVVR